MTDPWRQVVRKNPSMRPLVFVFCPHGHTAGVVVRTVNGLEVTSYTSASRHDYGRMFATVAYRLEHENPVAQGCKKCGPISVAGHARELERLAAVAERTHRAGKLLVEP
jgi:hypothetical protein